MGKSMSTILNRTEQQENAFLMSALKRYFGEFPGGPDTDGSESNLLEALRIYFRDKD